jgi:hypothetical protein
VSFVHTKKQIADALFGAWFDSRADIAAVCLSAQQSENKDRINTSYWLRAPTPPFPNINDLGTAWGLNYYALGTYLQAWLVGVGNGPIWITLQEPTVPLESLHGPLFLKSFPERVFENLQHLRQDKGRSQGLWMNKAGLMNELNIRVPHR